MEYMKMLEKMHEELEHELDEEIHEAPKVVEEKPVLPIPDDKRTSQKAYDYTRGTPSDPDILDKRNKGT